MERVILTGGNGFIGRWLIKELLKEGIEVYSVVRKKSNDTPEKVHTVACDMSNIHELPSLIQERNFDAFIHLAWEGSTGIQRADYDVQIKNVQYSCDAIKAAKELQCKKFMAAGTITEKIVENVLNNNSEIPPNLIYGIAKVTAYNFLQAVAKQLNIDFVWMRFSNVFGPGNYTGNLIGYTITSIMEGKTPEFSKALQPYDFIYVKDLVHAIVLLERNTLHCREYFLGSGCSRILREYLKAIPKALNKEIEMKIGARADDGIEYNKEWFDISALTADTGYESHYTFEEAIRETLKNALSYNGGIG